MKPLRRKNPEYFCFQSLKLIKLLSAFGILNVSLACSIDSARNHYVLAEKLWTDRKYQAAVQEFEKAISKDSHSKLGRQALYRAAMTQYLFLSQYSDAIRKLKLYVESSTDPKESWDAQLQIGEILYFKTEQYDQAILHYQSLRKEKPQSAESSEFLFRIAKSQFYLLQLDDALGTYEEVIKEFPKSKWAEKAAFEMGVTAFTRGEQISETDHSAEIYKKAKKTYEEFIKNYPQSELLPQARFGVASCLEELDQLQDAIRIYQEIQQSYPAQQVIQSKITRIRERISHKASAR